MKSKFSQKVLKIVKNIKSGNFLTYKEVAEKAGNRKAVRATAQILKISPQDIPCHRVIRSDNLVGGYMGKENLDWMKAGLLLKEGAIGVIPTDTIYGICASAFNKKSVEKVYKLRKRNSNKPCIILIFSFDDFKKFEIKLKPWQRKILEKIWPGKVSVILSCFSQKFYYLHRGTNSLAFRFPKNKLILNILKISGPLIAPSANWEGHQPAINIKEAKRYFDNKVFYLDRGDLISKPSTLIDLRERKIRILREGKNIKKILKVLQ